MAAVAAGVVAAVAGGEAGEAALAVAALHLDGCWMEAGVVLVVIVNGNHVVLCIARVFTVLVLCTTDLRIAHCALSLVWHSLQDAGCLLMMQLTCIGALACCGSTDDHDLLPPLSRCAAFLTLRLHARNLGRVGLP